ncbi:speedy protein 1-B-like [Rhinophrynus dorsalis]
MEEDLPFDIGLHLWALGESTHQTRAQFSKERDQLWARMGYRAYVTRQECDQMMAEEPTFWAWNRERREHHGWAIRMHARRNEEFLFRKLKPDCITPFCSFCRAKLKQEPQQWIVIGNKIIPAFCPKTRTVTVFLDQ